jgi:hypothetical protein
MRTDDMVREALADLAPTAPADNTALAGVHRAIGRRRRRQHVAQAVAAVALAIAAVGTGALVLRAEDDNVQTGNEGTSTTVPTTATTPTSTATTPTTATGGDAANRQTFGPVSFVLPDGWEVIYQNDTPSTDLATGEPGPTGETLCIAPVDAAGEQVGLQWDGCSGLMIHQGDFLPGKEMDPYQPDDYWAWHHHTDTNPCPNNAGNPDDGVIGTDQDGEAPIAGGFRDVGDKTANYNRWRAVCAVSRFTFEPQAWFLPQSKVLIFDVFGHDETEAFLASFQFDG